MIMPQEIAGAPSGLSYTASCVRLVEGEKLSVTTLLELPPRVVLSAPRLTPFRKHVKLDVVLSTKMPNSLG